jgi:hypothetical protein
MRGLSDGGAEFASGLWRMFREIGGRNELLQSHAYSYIMDNSGGDPRRLRTLIGAERRHLQLRLEDCGIPNTQCYSM